MRRQVGYILFLICLNQSVYSAEPHLDCDSLAQGYRNSARPYEWSPLSPELGDNYTRGEADVDKMFEMVMFFETRDPRYLPRVVYWVNGLIDYARAGINKQAVIRDRDYWVDRLGNEHTEMLLRRLEESSTTRSFSLDTEAGVKDRLKTLALIQAEFEHMVKQSTHEITPDYLTLLGSRLAIVLTPKKTITDQ